MGINVQRSACLCMTQQAGNRAHVHALRNQHAGIGVAQAIDIQIQRQVVCFQNQLETIGECARVHRLTVRLAEQVVILVHGFVRGLHPIPFALVPPRFEQLAHLLAQIYQSISTAGLGVFRD